MRVCVLGPLELGAGSERAGALRSGRVRRLLAVLLVNAGQVVSTDRLADAVWDDAQPADPAGALQTLVSRLRTAIGRHGDGLELRTSPPGYVLEVGPELLDAARFEDLLAAGRARLADDPGQAAELLGRALDLWRGPAYAEFADAEPVRAEAARLDELRLVAVEELAEALLAAGRAADTIAVLEPLLAAHPLRERARGQHMLALHRAGRSADALAAFRTWRATLADELGLEPSPDLARLESEILRQDPGLDAPAAPAVRPRPVTALIGREGELAAISAALGAARVVTLTGPGGVGKTRLALALADAVTGNYPDGARLCELAAVSDQAEVVDAVATTIGLPPGQGLDLLERLVESLRGRRMLLVVDNCEHVLDEVARLVEAVASGCPGVTVLATSRVHLRVEGEQVWPVPTLPLPEPGSPGEAAEAADSPAVRLFAERAAAASPGFAVTGDNLAAVTELCRRLDGLPLALELGATLVRSMRPEDISARLVTRFRLLRSGRRVADARHRTLLGVVQWSYDLLGEAQRLLFERVSVFAGAFGLDAAEQVCGGDGIEQADVAGLLAGLVDSSMVVALAGEGRFVLLETLRAYGRQRLAERGQAEAVGRAHAEYWTAWAEQAGAGLAGPDEARWAASIGQAVDELRAAHAWALPARPDLALRLSAALVWFAEFQLVAEVFAWAERAVAAAPAGHPLLPVALGSAAAGARFRGDLAGSVELAERGLLALADGDGSGGRAYLLHCLQEVAVLDGRLEEAIDLGASAASAAAAAGGDRHLAVYAATDRVLALGYSGDTAAALDLAGTLAAEAAATGNPSMLGWVSYATGETLMAADPARAATLLDEAAALARSVGNRYLGGSRWCRPPRCTPVRAGTPRRCAATVRRSGSGTAAATWSSTGPPPVEWWSCWSA